VTSAGRTQVRAVEETTDDELRPLFELHFFAPVALTMRAHGGATIVRMSSLGSQITAPGFGGVSARAHPSPSSATACPPGMERFIGAGADEFRQCDSLA
jgi:hypothetical protein